jgi:hypothetical protein
MLKIVNNLKNLRKRINGKKLNKIKYKVLMQIKRNLKMSFLNYYLVSIQIKLIIL